MQTDSGCLYLKSFFYILYALSSYFYCKDGNITPPNVAARYHFFSNYSESIFLFAFDTSSVVVMPVVLNRSEGIL